MAINISYGCFINTRYMAMLADRDDIKVKRERERERERERDGLIYTF